MILPILTEIFWMIWPYSLVVIVQFFLILGTETENLNPVTQEMVENIW